MKKIISFIICSFLPILITSMLVYLSTQYLQKKCGVQPKVATLISAFEWLFCLYGIILAVILNKISK
jgi:hypothetical protein